MSSFPPKSLLQNITLLFLMAQIDTLDHAESTGDVQEKKARNYTVKKKRYFPEPQKKVR